LKKISLILVGILMPVMSAHSREGTPLYYQNYAPQQNFNVYQNPRNPYAQPVMVGNQPSRAIVGQSSSSQVIAIPRDRTKDWQQYMTPNGVALQKPTDWEAYAFTGRRFSNFQFETGVQSILKWDDMVWNELGAGLKRDFKMQDYDLFAFGEYTQGTFVSAGGHSYDYDMKPYDNAYPDVGLFYVSMGGSGGDTSRIRFGLGAKNVFDVQGWKLSPVVGYEIFRHNLTMKDHEYPNPAVYIPMLNEYGDYIIGDVNGNYYSLPAGNAIPDGYYQVCLGPEDLAIAASQANGAPQIDANGNLIMIGYDPLIMGYLPWGVGPGECVIIGGDGMVVVWGTTHIYNTTWTSIYVGLELEKQMTYQDKLRFYAQIAMPNYSSDGIWPNRTDWQQNPSFIDAGNTDSTAYRLEMEYTWLLNENLHLNIKADTEYYYVGAIPGTLFVNKYSTYIIDDYGQYVVDPNTGYPVLETVAAHSEHIPDSLRYARWQSFGLNIGLKYTF
jgi:hypothetical protein